MGLEDWPAAYGNRPQWLPPGFRFHPTDEELVTCYLAKKVQNDNFTDPAIVEVDLNKCEPWDLPGKAIMGEKEWYFYSLLDRKYPTGMRTNRATDAGYWKATGKDREVISSRSNTVVGMKKTLVFYKGRAPKGEKTNWVMHEYRLEINNVSRTTKEERVVCRVFQKNMGGYKTSLQCKRLYVDYDASFSSLPPLLESPQAPPSKGVYNVGECETFSSYRSLMKSSVYEQGFAEPTHPHDEESPAFSNYSSSYLQSNIAYNLQNSTAVCATNDSDNGYQSMNTLRDLTGTALNIDVELPWLSTNLASDVILKVLMNPCNPECNDVKPNFVSNMLQPKPFETGFLLDGLNNTYHEFHPETSYGKEKQQMINTVPSRFMQQESNLSMQLKEEPQQPNACNSRLTRYGSNLDLENFWK